jgi:hypothetical protein
MNWLNGMAKNYGICVMDQNTVSMFYDGIKGREADATKAEAYNRDMLSALIVENLKPGSTVTMNGNQLIVKKIKPSKLNGIIVVLTDGIDTYEFLPEQIEVISGT